MPSSTPPDPDTVQYPVVHPHLFLSVSNDPPRLSSRVKTPFAFYVEKFALGTDIVTENESEQPLNEYGVFTGDLYGPEKTTAGCKIVLTGKRGDEDKPNGYQGGVLKIYAEHMLNSTAEKIHLYARGGPGANREAAATKDTGPDGGNGGNGGTIAVIVDSTFQLAVENCLRFMEALDNKQKRWPTDFVQYANDFVALITLKEIQDTCQTPDCLKTAEGALKTSKDSIIKILNSFFKALLHARERLTASLEQHSDVSGGSYGTGGKGIKEYGKAGIEGKPGNSFVYRMDDADDILDSDICFAHPTQCRMLLDMANLLWFCGSLNEKAQAADICSRLVRRLGFLGTAKDKEKVSKTNLAKAYRKAEPSLFIISGAANDEPLSFSLLRAIKDEAQGNLMSLLSGKSILGEIQEKVPRGSFKFYEKVIESLLRDLESSEKTYRQFLNGEMDAQQKQIAVHERSSKCEFRRSLIDNQIQQLKNDLDDYLQRITISTESIGPAKKSLMNAFNPVKDKIETHVDVSFEDLMSALSQVIFVHGSGPMVAVQGADLVDTAIKKLESDSGAKIKRSLLIREVRNIDDSIKGLAEGYRLLKDGGVNFDDPGATKLQTIAGKTEDLLGQFEDIFGKKVLDNVKKRFNDYISILKQRNSAVVGYTITSTTLIKCQTQLDALAVELSDISRQEYDLLGADHPTMTALMKRLYSDAIHTTQQWLYRAQLAYRYVSLDTENLIGKRMEGFKFSQFNATTLRSIHSTLSTRYGDYIEQVGSSAQTYKGLKYGVDDFYVSMIQDSGTDGILHSVSIPVIPSTGPNPFGSMVDIRLTKVRFYLEGAKTSDNFLDVSLKHQGTETIVNKQHVRYDFDHAPIIVKFKYNLKNTQDMGAGTTDGDIGSIADDTYAKVGPFTNWTFQISKQNNPGLDLSDVQKAYFQFWFTYYETM